MFMLRTTIILSLSVSSHSLLFGLSVLYYSRGCHPKDAYKINYVCYFNTVTIHYNTVRPPITITACG